MMNKRDPWQLFLSGNLDNISPTSSIIYRYLVQNWSEDMKQQTSEQYSSLIIAMDSMKNLLKDINKDPEASKLFYEEIKKRQN